MSMNKLILACSLILGTLGSAAAGQAEAETRHNATAKKPAPKKAAKNTAEAAAPALAGDPEEANEPVVTDDTVTEYDCELGNKITIYTNAGDDAHIALRWKKRLHRLTRVGTTTGANRFENKLYGLVWIGIPAKGMLLDSKQNRQLANECRSPEQSKPAPAQ